MSGFLQLCCADCDEIFHRCDLVQPLQRRGEVGWPRRPCNEAEKILSQIKQTGPRLLRHWQRRRRRRRRHHRYRADGRGCSQPRGFGSTQERRGLGSQFKLLVFAMAEALICSLYMKALFSFV